MIQTFEISKKFGDFTAVDKVSIHVHQGEIYGLLGPNGAGKSTLIRMLTTLTTPTGGTALIDGFDIVKQADQVREVVGSMPEEYQDLLPMPWARIEAALKKGETVQRVGKSRERKIVLLAAPTESQLNKLIQKSRLLSGKPRDK